MSDDRKLLMPFTGPHYRWYTTLPWSDGVHLMATDTIIAAWMPTTEPKDVQNPLVDNGKRPPTETHVIPKFPADISDAKPLPLKGTPSDKKAVILIDGLAYRPFDEEELDDYEFLRIDGKKFAVKLLLKIAALGEPRYKLGTHQGSDCMWFECGKVRGILMGMAE